jgi:hypothetical protein
LEVFLASRLSRIANPNAEENPIGQPGSGFDVKLLGNRFRVDTMAPQTDLRNCPMITGAIKSQIDRIWDAFWSGGISNPLEVIEQITYLLFIRRLDEL